MFPTIQSFLEVWVHESASTQKILNALTDASLSQSVSNDHRTLGRMAWHIAQTLPEMMHNTGLTVAGVDAHAPVPSSAKTIADGYAAASASLVKELQANWTDATLGEMHSMYGQQWPRRLTLQVLVMHQNHHRGQMTVLMRQAGLAVPGVYGPAKEEWGAIGMPSPAI